MLVLGREQLSSSLLSSESDQMSPLQCDKIHLEIHRETNQTLLDSSAFSILCLYSLCQHPCMPKYACAIALEIIYKNISIVFFVFSTFHKPMRARCRRNVYIHFTLANPNWFIHTPTISCHLFNGLPANLTVLLSSYILNNQT